MQQYIYNKNNVRNSQVNDTQRTKTILCTEPSQMRSERWSLAIATFANGHQVMVISNSDLRMFQTQQQQQLGLGPIEIIEIIEIDESCFVIRGGHFGYFAPSLARRPGEVHQSGGVSKGFLGPPVRGPLIISLYILI